MEGWCEYGVKEMVDAGYAGDDPRFVLMVLKIRMRVVANAILDIRMQTTLTTYYIGFHQWIALRDACQKDAGARFDLKRFNDAVLNEGAVPVPLLRQLLPAAR